MTGGGMLSSSYGINCLIDFSLGYFFFDVATLAGFVAAPKTLAVNAN